MQARPASGEERQPRRMAARLAVSAAFVTAAAALVVVLLRDETAQPSSSTQTASTLPGAMTAPAPWPPNGEDLDERLDRLGLPRLARAGQALHIHVLLQIVVDGRPVPIPPGIGFDPNQEFLAPIHTHDATGKIHVESNEVRTFHLGDVFDVWGLSLDERCLGPYCDGDGATLRFSVDGRPVETDPRAIELRDGEVIRVEFSAG